jgi:hypothetical protein
VADGVDAAVDAGEAAGGDPLSYAARAQAAQLQLGKGDHPVLALGELTDPRVPRGFGTKRPT